MPCVNHPGNPVEAYCQNCGKALCGACVRTGPTGQVFCENCQAAAAANPAGAAWVGGPAGPYTPNAGFPLPMASSPNPSAAAVLGLIPGAGAFYNGQYFKGLIHVVVFVVLVSITDRYGLFGLFVAAWVLYQSFEAYHTAKARRDGHPLPDPFGLNEVGSWLNLGGKHPNPHGNPNVNPPAPGPFAPGPFAPNPSAPNPGQAAAPDAATYTAPYTSSWSSPQASGPYPGPNPAADPAPDPAAAYTQPPYTEPWAGGWAGPGSPQDPYASGYTTNYPPGTVPPIPPVPPYRWQRKEPVFAIVLIGLGVIFLLQSMGFVTHLMHYIWPVALIGIGVWLIYRRMSDSQGGSK